MISEEKELYDAVDKFAVEMKLRLNSKRKQGWSGWRHAKDIPGRLLRNAAKGVVMKDQKSLVDTANLAMFLWLTKR